MHRINLARILVVSISIATGCNASSVDVPAGIDHSSWNALLQKYVNDRGLVNYQAWMQNKTDRNELRTYIASFAGTKPFAMGDEKAATLINAYNALTINWILENYPITSIKSTSDPWDKKRHRVGDRDISLDEIEHDTLRPLIGYSAHAVLVCAAKSCPPLYQHAYTAELLNSQLEDRMRTWLARDDLNTFRPDKGQVVISKIFRWFRKDFDDAGGTQAVLLKYAPNVHTTQLKGDYTIRYNSYDWSLNEQ